MEAAGFSPKVQFLKEFEDDYGLKLDGDEEEDEDDDEEEEYEDGEDDDDEDDE